jgi:hypothetical protein
MNEILAALGIKIGDNVFLRSLTDHYVGRLVAIFPHVAVLEDAAWVADSGRLHMFIADGKAANMEIEPVGRIAHHWQGLLPWAHKLFTRPI